MCQAPWRGGVANIAIVTAATRSGIPGLVGLSIGALNTSAAWAVWAAAREAHAQPEA